MDWDGAGLLIVNEQANILGGQERVFETLLERYPKADALALSFAAGSASGGRQPHGSERVRALRVPGRRRPLLTPLYAGRVAMRPPNGARLVLSITQGGSALGVRLAPGARLVAYSSGPPSLHTQSELALADERPALRPVVRAALPLLRTTHRRLIRRPDRMIANSAFTAGFLRHAGGIAADVIQPPVRADFFKPRPRERCHWLAVGRIAGQKRFDLLVEAFARTDAPLVIAGTGASLPRLRASASPNVRFVGFADDEELRELYRSAHALICPSLETFGLVMAEALACGTPVVGQRAGGSLELVEEGVTGVFLDEPGPAGVLDAMARLERLEIDPEACRRSIEGFSGERFLARIGRVLADERALAGS